MIFATSDPHFFHGQDEGEPRGVIKHCNRPFSNRKAMNEALWNNINRVVGRDDLLICLGDWVYGVGSNDDYYIKCCREARYNINCKNVWTTYGNHDRHWMERFRKIFNRFLGFGYELLFTEELCDRFDVHKYRWLDRKQRRDNLLTCCHYGLRVWNKSHRTTWSIYGHSHDSLPDEGYLAMDVGVDAKARRLSVDGIRRPEDYEPFSLDEIAEIMSKKTFRPVDHHGQREGERV